MKVYRGNPAAARHYVETDHARVDDYYLAEGTGLAERFTASPDLGVEHLGSLDGDGYEAWVAGLDPGTGESRGRLRQDPQAVRFVEVVVNGPKSWSLAAALDPQIAAAYDAAMDRAATQVIGWLAEHATTRVGPRGRQVQVPVERLEAVTVRHYTSRAGDPHRHLHLQINARVFADGKWRGLHTVGVRDSLDAINGIGHAAVMCDPEFRGVLADRGYTLDSDNGEIDELARFAGAFSARARQIARNIDRYETAWREAHPGQEPGPELLRAWDRRAWAEARPDKVIPTDGSDLTDRWVTELRRLGFHDPTRTAPLLATKPGTLDRTAAVDEVLTRLGFRRSGWNAADVRGEVEQLLARTGVVTDAAVRCEVAEDLTARTLEECLPLLPHDAPEHVRALTSVEVLRVEADLTTRMAARATVPGAPAAITGGRLDQSQRDAVAALAGTHRLIVVEGAAGAGKTATLRATRSVVEQQGRRMVVVTPTLKAAQVACGQVAARAFSAAWLAHQHGYRWDEHGCWTRDTSQPRPDALLKPGDLLVIDEAGMLDQDTARALLTIADEADASVAFLGDRHQLPAVGRGGVLDHAARWAQPTAVVTLDRVHRFSDPTYGDLSLAMREGHNAGAVFDELVARGEVVVHASEQARTQALAAEAAANGALVIADTHEQVRDLNAAIRDHLVAAGRVDDQRVVVTALGERIGVGDRIATRRNDYDRGVANRDTWTVALVEPDGHLHLTNGRADRVVDPAYVRRHVELAYATTVHGAQGDTVPTAQLSVAEHTGAASAYVGMTRGRDSNTAHLVADTLDEARQKWIEVFARDRADLGPAHAARLAVQEAAKYGTPRAPAVPGGYASPKRRKSIARPARPGAPVPAPVRTGEPRREPARPPELGL